jgi:hypothetical protein
MISGAFGLLSAVPEEGAFFYDAGFSDIYKDSDTRRNRFHSLLCESQQVWCSGDGERSEAIFWLDKRRENEAFEDFFHLERYYWVIA